jgi:2-keto-3-deoxy-L-rhamnonate aldolase RhmA
MKINAAKQKMLRGEPALGYSAKLGSPVAAEFLSHSGADFVVLDSQHGAWGQDSLIQGPRLIQQLHPDRAVARCGGTGHRRADGGYG